MRILSLITLVLFVSSLAAPARAGMVEDCSQELDRGLGISGCTAVIRSGQYSGKNLAAAYSNRGGAYFSLGDHARAIEDYDQALRLDPDDTVAYSNRGRAYDNLGEYRRAIQDYDQALRLDPGNAYAYTSRGAAYQVIIRAHQWRAGKMKPRVYGEEQVVDVNHGLEKMNDDELLARAEQLGRWARDHAS